MPDVLDRRNIARKRGRPLGSKDSYQRPPRSKDPDGEYQPRGPDPRVAQLEAELNKAYAKIADYEQFLALRPFPGDSLALLQATQRGTYHPTLLQFRAAQVIWEEDLDRRRVALDGQRLELEARDRDVDRAFETLDKFIALVREDMPDRVAAGDITAAFAEQILSWWDDPVPPPLALPAPVTPAAAHAPDGAPATDPPPTPIARPRSPATPQQGISAGSYGRRDPSKPTSRRRCACSRPTAPPRSRSTAPPRPTSATCLMPAAASESNHPIGRTRGSTKRSAGDIQKGFLQPPPRKQAIPRFTKPSKCYTKRKRFSDR